MIQNCILDEEKEILKVCNLIYQELREKCNGDVIAGGTVIDPKNSNFSEETMNETLINILDELKKLNTTIANTNAAVNRVWQFMYNENIKTSYYGNVEDVFLVKKYKQLRKLTRVMDVIGHKKIRVGRQGDGGYIVLDDFSKIEAVYSFGISNEVSFDLEMANRGIHIYQYDHTVNNPPIQHENFHFFKTGVCGNGNSNPALKTVIELLTDNGHENMENILFKMDVEGAEFASFEAIPSEIMDKFLQITLEVHGINNINYQERNIKFFEKINETHQCIHVHANNAGGVDVYGNYAIPGLLEFTFVRRRDYEFQENNEIFPTELDYPNVGRPEIYLGKWS